MSQRNGIAAKYKCYDYRLKKTHNRGYKLHSAQGMMLNDYGANEILILHYLTRLPPSENNSACS